MTIFGYDDENQCWIIKNSGGSDWGEEGYIRMHYYSTFFAEWYGEGTGVMYIDGAYGNIEPDVPKIYIMSPKIFHSYFFTIELPQLFRTLPSIQKASPRIIGTLSLKGYAENTDTIKIMINNELYKEIDGATFDINLDINQGLHTITTVAYDEKEDISKDIIDVFIIS